MLGTEQAISLRCLAPIWANNLGVKDVADALKRSERDIRLLARAAKDGPDRAEWPALRDRTTGSPITDQQGFAYVVTAVPNARRGRPALSRGEEEWSFLRFEPPGGKVTLAMRYLQPGSTVRRGPKKIIKGISAETGITPGSPLRELREAKPGELSQVISADTPGPVLGMLLRREDSALNWQTKMGDHVDVLVQGTLLLPAEGPIGCGPGIDRLLWDPNIRRWRGELVQGQGSGVLELFGNHGIDNTSDGSEPVAVNLFSNDGLRLDWASHPDP